MVVWRSVFEVQGRLPGAQVKNIENSNSYGLLCAGEVADQGPGHAGLSQQDYPERHR